MEQTSRREASSLYAHGALLVAFGASSLLSPPIKNGKGDSPLRNVLNVEDIIVDTQTHAAVHMRQNAEHVNDQTHRRSDMRCHQAS